MNALPGRKISPISPIINYHSNSANKSYHSIREATLAPLPPQQKPSYEPSRLPSLKPASAQVSNIPTPIIDNVDDSNSIFPIPRPNPPNKKYNVSHSLKLSSKDSNDILGEINGQLDSIGQYSTPPARQMHSQSIFLNTNLKETCGNSDCNKNHDKIGSAEVKYQFETSPIQLKQSTASSQVNVDPDIPCVLKFCAANNITHETGLTFPQQPLSSDLNPTDPRVLSLIEQKVDFCSNIFDFTINSFQIPEKEAKSRILCEFIEMFESTRCLQLFTLQHQALVFRLLQKNIFDQDPYIPSQVLRGLDQTTTVIEPSWPHLFYCFQILNRFVQVFPKSPLLALFEEDINKDRTKEQKQTNESYPPVLVPGQKLKPIWKQSPVLKALVLIQLPDSNERMQFVAFLRTYYDQHLQERPYMLNIIKNIIIDIRDGQKSETYALPFVIFLTHTFMRVQQDNAPILAKYLLVLVDQLLSLRVFTSYSTNIKQLISLIINHNQDLCIPILQMIEKKWPICGGNKETAFLELLISVIQKTKVNDIKPFAQRLFAFFGICVQSPNSNLSMLACEIWVKCSNEPWLSQNSRIGISQMFEPIWRVNENYWCKATQEKAAAALSEMCKLHKSQYHKLKTELISLQVKRTKLIHSNRTLKNWAHIAKIASQNDSSINYKNLIHNWKEMFVSQRAKLDVVSRFMTGNDQEFVFKDQN